MSFDTSFARQAIARCCHTTILLGLTCFAAQSAVAQSIFINEVHYDNAGADSGEAIEIAGPAGTDLAGWSIALYNGSATQLNVYNTINLSGEIPNQENGFGVLAFPQAGIQNGSPDGMALVNASNNVVEFLSYEGSFTAASGPASGLTSTDIGVAESGSAAVGSSLQLTGSGTERCDFGWAGSATSTFGAVNTGQSFGGSGVPCTGVIINEVDADTPGSDALEFIELFDGGVGNTALDGLVVVLFNGSNNLSYNAFDLDGFSTDADGYFVLGNVAVTPSPSIIFPGNGLQNGADAVALYVDDAASFPNGTGITTTNLSDAIVYDTSDADDAELLVLLNAAQPQVNENGGGDKDNHSSQRCPNGSGGARNTSTYEQFVPTAGSNNICIAAARFLKIHEVQGSGLVSPEVGNIVIIEGIVVGDFQDGASGTNGDLNGFHVQEEDADADGDPATSEGIFIFDGSSPAVDVQIGDLVRAEGVVSEFGSSVTEITSFSGVTVLSSNNPLPTPAVLSLPVSSVDDFEAFEGMSVSFPQALVISEYFNFDRFNEIVLTSERHLTPTAEFEPGPAAIAAANAFLLDKITLDDGRTGSNPDPAIHPNGLDFDLGNLFRGGDMLTDVTGVMDHSFGLYRIQPTQGANYLSNNPRTAAPEPVGGTLRLASFNTLNYFSTIDDGVNDICGPLQNLECRGADDAGEFTRQRDKTIAAIIAIDAHVIGLLEIENNINDDAVADLVDGLNAETGPGSYASVATGAIGTDAIKVAMIYKPASVSTLGGHAILDSSVDARFIDAKNRPTLAQTFIDNATGGVFTVAVNHFKSKGSDCDDIGDPDLNDGAGNCNLTRESAAEAVVDWLADDPTGSGDDDFIIIGDLNSYDKEDPIDVIVAGGYTDLLETFRGEDAYSFVFDGQVGYLDYALAGASLMDEVTGAVAWHINADEPDLIDYDTSFKKPNQDAIYAPDAYRSSDHDPLVVGLDTCDEIAPTIDEVSVTPDVLWPANHKYVDVTATVSTSDNFDPNVTVTLVSVTSNEPDNGKGDGNTVNDIVTIDDLHVKLRAERSGRGSGRIYTLTYLATDACGNSSATASATVTVPHDKGKKKP